MTSLGGSTLSSACPHQIQTFSRGFSLAVPHAVIWERTGREETADLVSEQLNPQDLLWLLPHPPHGRRFQSGAGAGAARTEVGSALPRSSRPFPVLDVPPLSRAPRSRLPQEEQQLYSDREHGASSARHTRRHAFGTGTSQSIACMFGDALL